MMSFRSNFFSQASSAILRDFFSFHWCATRLPSSKNVCHCPSKVRKRLRNCRPTLQQPVVSFCQSLKPCPVFLMLKLSELDFSKNSQREPFCLATVGALPSRKAFKAANIANPSCQIWQNVLESHLSSHAVPPEPAHDGSA